MTTATHEHRGLIATIVGTGIAVLAVLLGVLVPLQLSLYSQQSERIDRLEDALRSEVAGVDGRVQGLGERVARIEGRLDAVLPAITLAPPEPPADQ